MTMGDRANIAIKQQIKDEKGNPVYIYFYTHWSGSELPEILKSALIRGQSRWGDDQYLSRIIFSEMIQNDVLNETGYGIGTYIGDNEHTIIYVDNNAQTVSIGDKTYSFEEYTTTADVYEAYD
jgi:hypothetical protein